jgi:prepilin-type N-terminal cleavage/methylation domain-containing protein
MSEASMQTLGVSRKLHRGRAGFTLIEVLVVVAIIAVLIAVLLPTLAQARETSKRSVCASHLHQQALGFSAYSADNRGILPWTAKFRYALMEGLYYHNYDKPRGDDWATFNSGSLFPKYVGGNPEVFYCPSNLTFNASNPDNGKEIFLQRFHHPKRTDPQYQNSHNFPISPYYSYAYAVPAAVSRSPKDAGPNMYPRQTIQNNWPCETSGPDCLDSPYWQYLNDPAEPDPSFLGAFPKAARGRHTIHAFVSDGYFSDGNLIRSVLGYHGGGFNVLYSDYHAKWVNDPSRRIYKMNSPPLYSTYNGINNARVFMVWDYFSRNH